MGFFTTPLSRNGVKCEPRRFILCSLCMLSVSCEGGPLMAATRLGCRVRSSCCSRARALPEYSGGPSQAPGTASRSCVGECAFLRSDPGLLERRCSHAVERETGVGAAAMLRTRNWLMPRKQVSRCSGAASTRSGATATLCTGALRCRQATIGTTPCGASPDSWGKLEFLLENLALLAAPETHVKVLPILLQRHE